MCINVYVCAYIYVCVGVCTCMIHEFEGKRSMLDVFLTLYLTLTFKNYIYSVCKV